MSLNCLAARLARRGEIPSETELRGCGLFADLGGDLFCRDCAFFWPMAPDLCWQFFAVFATVTTPPSYNCFRPVYKATNWSELRPAKMPM